jgi:SAM-dependent methyltransferase
LAELTGLEFTGERVIPGQVNDDLWSEHVARYAFARRYAQGLRVLDAGCGAGYGSAELAQSAALVTGIDVAAEAIEYARATYPISNVRFVAGSCTAIPFPDKSFELVVAFEVIEHLAEFRAFLNECARVVTPQGLFLVSSPNKGYYTESRAEKGPNPYHEREFEAAEFVSELSRVFPSVRLLLQNRVESFAFHPANSFWPAEARIDGGGGAAEDANFFIGMCSAGPLPEARSFVYVPKAANLLREREQHVQLLESQLARTKKWLAETQTERDALLELHRRQKEELESRNRWAEKLNAELQSAGERVAAVQNELASEQQAAAAVATGYESKVAGLEDENRAKTEWAVATEARLSQELEQKGRELAECARLLDTAEATVTERTLWAQRVEAQRQELAAQMEMIRASRWLKLGQKLGLGPPR